MTSSLYHHGIKGQKWGLRRYQNEDGSLTDLGKNGAYHLKKTGESFDNAGRAEILADYANRKAGYSY